MNRQDPLLSSSSRRDISSASQNVRAKSIGCISGIFQCLYKYPNRRRFLTSGKKQEKNAITGPSSPPKESGIKNPKLSDQAVVPRSPTIPPEIRVVSSSESLRNAPAVVARLMGLNEAPTPPESAVAEKRRRLLGALKKCDDDLKAIKKMIEVVKTVGHNNVNDGDSNNNSSDKIQVYYEKRAESQAIHQTVFDEFSRSALYGHWKRYAATPIGGGAPIHQRRKPGEEDIITTSFFDRIFKAATHAKRNNYDNLATPLLWRNKGMIESVNEVCKDIAWGERREVGRIGLALQDYICKDLIDETVKEIGSSCCIYPTFQLPLESCKRSLRF